MRKAGLVFVVSFAAALGAGLALPLQWEVRTGAAGPSRPADEPPPRPPVADDAFTPAGYARFAAAYPAERGGRAGAFADLVKAADKRKRAVEAYAAVGPEEAREAFRRLARYCCNDAGYRAVPLDRPEDRVGADALRRLVAAHEARCGPDPDPETGLYKAYLLYWEGRAAEAEPGLVAAVAAFPDAPGPLADEARLARDCRADVYADLGRWKDAATPLPPGVTFEGLFWRLYRRRQPDDADLLLARYAREAADDPRRPACQMFADYGRGRYAGCLAAADLILAATDPAAPAGPGPSARPYRTDAKLFRVRALARLGRLAEADAALAADGPGVHAEALKDEVELLVALLAGDEARADRVLGRGRLTPGRFGDPALEPLLRADRWAALRAKYPPPANP